MTSTLGNLLKNVASAEERGNDFFKIYGMHRNPFPPARTIYPEVIYNQEEAVTRFAEGITAIIGDEIERRSLAVLGGTGQGKSHFQRHCQYEVQQSRLPVVTVEFLAGTGSAPVLVREMYRAADEFVKQRGEHDLLSAVVNKLEGDDLGPIRQTDLRAALKKLVEASDPEYQPADMHGRFDFPTLLDVCRRWIIGETLTQIEKRYLRVSGRLSSGALMIRVMTEIFSLARELSLFRGVMLCLDEVEAIFFSGASTSRIQSFLQDLRYLFDEARGQSSGYSLLIVSGSTGQGAQSLGNYNYPLFQRLGFESEARVQLHQVSNLEEARRFADVYLEHEHERAMQLDAGIKKAHIDRARSLITNRDLEAAFAETDPFDIIGQLNQARLLEELHRVVERKRNSHEDL